MVINKKIKSILVIILIVIEVIILFLMYKTITLNSNIETNNFQNLETDCMFAIMLGDKDKKYTQSESKKWPSVLSYNFNEGKSGCLDQHGNRVDGILSFNQETGIAKVITKDTVYCYLYFDIDTIPPKDFTFFVGGSNNPSYTTKEDTSIYISWTEKDVVSYCVSTTNNSANCIWQDLKGNSITADYTLTSPDGIKTIYVFLKDEAGNVSTGVYDTITLDTTPPKITINPVGTPASNSWYTSMSVSATITDDTTSVTSKLYCVTTNNSCTPNTNLVGSVSLNSNKNPQRVCFKATDSAGNENVLCSEPYKVDKSTTTTTWSLASSTNASNNWYKAASIKVQGNNDYSGIAKVTYCVTTSATCTPNTPVTASNTTIKLNNNASSQKVCANATDNKGSTSQTVCSTAYAVDNVSPTGTLNISRLNSSATASFTSVKDDHSKVRRYYYLVQTSSTCPGAGNSNYNSTTATSYSFSNLSDGTKYVCAYIEDTAGNTSSVYRQTFIVDDITVSSNTFKTINVSGVSLANAKIKYASGNQNAAYFTSSGTTITNSFDVSTNSMYTIALLSSSNEVVSLKKVYIHNFESSTTRSRSTTATVSGISKVEGSFASNGTSSASLSGTTLSIGASGGSYHSTGTGGCVSYNYSCPYGTLNGTTCTGSNYNGSKDNTFSYTCKDGVRYIGDTNVGDSDVPCSTGYTKGNIVNSENYKGDCDGKSDGAYTGTVTWTYTCYWDVDFPATRGTCKSYAILYYYRYTVGVILS